MATIASLVANPIMLRPKFKPQRIGSTHNRLDHRSNAFSGCANSNFNVVDGRRKKLFSTAGTSSRHHASTPPPNANANANSGGIRRDHLGIGIGIGKPHGRMGGKWEYPYCPNPWASAASFSEGCFVTAFIVWIPLMLSPCGLPTFIRALGVISWVALSAMSCWCNEKTSVVKLQVGFSGKGGECLGFDLSQIAQIADTSTNRGLTNVFNETIIALLRYYDCDSSSQISVVSKFGRAAADTHVDDLSIEARIKNKETLVNVNNLQMQNDDIMVTLLVGARRELAFPTIYNEHDFENVLHELRRIVSSDRMTAIEVIWTHASSCSPRTSM